MNNNKRILYITLVILIILLIGLFYIFETKEASLPIAVQQFVNNIFGNKTGNNCSAEVEKNCAGDLICLQNYRCIIGKNNSTNQTTPSNPSNPSEPNNPNQPEEPVEPYMDSENYGIAWDSVNSGGGYSSSETYQQENTVGEIGTGYSGPSENYGIHAGYQQTDAYTISISVDSDNINLGTIGAVSGGIKDGSTVATVTTNNPTGYTMSAKASTSPAMQSGANSFADYTAGGASPDYTWYVATGDAEFGFSPKGTDIKAFFKDNGTTACNTGSSQTAGKCWYPFSTSDVDVSSSSTPNNPSGTGTTFNVRIDSQKLMNVGTYTATITLTAITN